MQTLAKEMGVKGRSKLPKVAIASVTSDSRKAEAGALFVAVPGITVDGHDFVKDAVAQGCKAVVVEKGRCAKGMAKSKAICIEVADTRIALGKAAAAFWQHPAQEMKIVGITGTNGKTTITFLLEKIIKEAGGNPGVIGTVNYRYNGLEFPAPFTTPDAVALQKLLREMADNKVTHVLMEVSSHALEQKRVAGLSFDVAIFTNLSRDHLDFHGDMASYYESKKSLFTEYLKKDGTGLVMHHEEAADWGNRLFTELAESESGKKQRYFSCGCVKGDFAVTKSSEDLHGIKAKIATPQGELQVASKMVGSFNLENILSAAAGGAALGFEKEDIETGLKKAERVPGRLESVPAKPGVNVFVDFAHTPDALANVLLTLKCLGHGRLIVVFGCGGDRDRGKRPLMGAVAAKQADIVLVTSDNPRSEEPEAIIADIEQGLRGAGMQRMRIEALAHRKDMKGYDLIVSRRQAIHTALYHAQEGDIVAICGKGHETYQITKEGKTFFDDRQEALLGAGVINW